MKYIINIIVIICIIIATALLFFWQRNLERDFRGHYHHQVGHVEASIPTPQLFGGVWQYELTAKPKPKHTESSGYVYWSYCGRRY